MQEDQRKAASQAKVRQLLGMIPSGQCAGDVLSRDGPAGDCVADRMRGEVACGMPGGDSTSTLGVVRSLESFYTSCGVDFLKREISWHAHWGGQDDELSFA